MMNAIRALGEHPRDPRVSEIDNVGFLLERLQSLLVWMDEHEASFEKLRHEDSVSAEAELEHLKNATSQAVLFLQRLTELLLSGHTVDPGKRLPSGLNNPVWDRLVQALEPDRA